VNPAAGQVGNHFAGGFLFPKSELPGRPQNIIIDVERGSHTSDVIASDATHATTNPHFHPLLTINS
jgi:hypothetical protein